MKKQTKTILSDSGYILVKKYFNFKDINRTKKDLTVAPYVNQNYSAKAIPFPIFMESKNKLYLPKHYGLENFGDPDVKKIKSKGINISLDFIGDLRDKQINPINAFLKTCSKGSYSSKSKGGIISLPCGYGKTVCALFLIHKLKKKTLQDLILFIDIDENTYERSCADFCIFKIYVYKMLAQLRFKNTCAHRNSSQSVRNRYFQSNLATGRSIDTT